MNLTWHIAKKDLRRLRVHLLLWTVLLASQVFVSFRLLSTRSVDYTWFTETGMMLNLLEAVGMAVSFIIAAALVLDDPLVGTDLAWVTRPISGGRLLRAKLIATLLSLVLLPILVWMPWWFYCRFDLGGMAEAAVRVLGLQALAVIPGFVLASLVGRTGRFVLFSVLLVVALVVALMNLLAWGGYLAVSPELWLCRLLLAAAVLACSGVVVVGRQYLTRRLASSAGVLAAGVVLAGVIVACWPWNLADLRPVSREQVAGSERITGEITEARVTALDTTAPENNGISIGILFTGVPDEVSLSSGVADVELRWPDGRVAAARHLPVRPGRASRWTEDNEESSVRLALGLVPGHDWLHHWDPETNAKQDEITEAWHQRVIKAGEQWVDRSHQRGSARLYLTLAVTPEVAARVEAEPPACAISVRVGIKKPDVLLEMPLKGDTWTAQKGARVHLLNISPHIWRDVNQVQGKAYLATLVAASAPGLGGLSLHTVDRLHGMTNFQGRTYSFSVVPVAGNIEGLYFDVRDARLWRTDKWVEAPGWPDSASLVALTYRDVGGFNRDFHTDRLTIGSGGGD